jgi:hypothetical protein
MAFSSIKVRRLGLGALYALFAALAGCSSPGPTEGTNTNWVKCTTTADCTKIAASATCVANVCQLPDGAAAEQSVSHPSCTWPSMLDGDASSRATCHAARAYVSCSEPGGVTEQCVSDGDKSCPSSGSGSCTFKCADTEYVAVCGGIGPGPVPDPPGGCKFSGANPGGVSYYCCPCGT